MYRDRPGCLGGLLRLFLIDALFRFLQRSIGFGRGGLGGCGCGLILLILFACIIIGQICNIDWLRLWLGSVLF